MIKGVYRHNHQLLCEDFQDLDAWAIPLRIIHKKKMITVELILRVKISSLRINCTISRKIYIQNII